MREKCRLVESSKEEETENSKKDSTSGRIIEETSLNEEDEVFLKASYEKDDYEVTKSSYKRLFKISAKLVEENDRIKKRNLDLKQHA